MAAEALLGLAGETVEAADLSQWATKAGGWPCVAPDVDAEALRAAATCDVCGQLRSLVLQVTFTYSCMFKYMTPCVLCQCSSHADSLRGHCRITGACCACHLAPML